MKSRKLIIDELIFLHVNMKEHCLFCHPLINFIIVLNKYEKPH